MRVNTKAWQEAMKLRGHFASEFLKYHGPTDSAAGVCLVNKAREFGYTSRARAVPGSTLRNWMNGESVPQWATKTMIRYILQNGYIPESDNELDALLVYLFVDVEPDDISSVLHSSELKQFNDVDVNLSLRRIWHA